MTGSLADSVPADRATVLLVELDICGQICPSALLITLREVNERKQELRAGSARLRVRTDNRDSIITIPEALGNMGYTVEVTKEQGHYLLEIRGRPRDG